MPREPQRVRGAAHGWAIGLAKENDSLQLCCVFPDIPFDIVLTNADDAVKCS
jgi:hypothetical protein